MRHDGVPIVELDGLLSRPCTSAAAKCDWDGVWKIQAHSTERRRELYTTGRSDEREAEARERELVP